MSIILFYISFVLILGLFSIKYFEISVLRHEVIVKTLEKNDKHVHKIVGKGKHYVTKIRFENFHRLILMIINFVKKETIVLKRKFDSKQPKFFLKPQKQNSTNKSSVSFFLKKVSDYKDSLQHKDL